MAKGFSFFITVYKTTSVLEFLLQKFQTSLIFDFLFLSFLHFPTFIYIVKVGLEKVCYKIIFEKS